MPEPGRVATVLPPWEGFSPDTVGAIGLVVHRLAATVGGDVVGRPVPDAYTDVPFRPARPGWALSSTGRYASGVLRVLRRLQPALVPALVEVHNRPAVALALARHMPRVVLILHNDPLGMRDARTAREQSQLSRRLHGIVTVSAFLRDRFDPAVRAAVTVLPNAIDVPPSVHRVRERLILFVGRVVADKGADAFVAAAAAALPDLPGWQAEVIGADCSSPGADTPFLAAVRRQAEAGGVAMLGTRPHAEAMARMARAAIAVVPSRWDEPFGMVALEAMAHGAALICSHRGGLAEMAGDAALYVDPDAPGALAAAIRTLADDGERRQAMAVAGRLRARQFDTAQAAAALQAYRQGILTQPPMQPLGRWLR